MPLESVDTLDALNPPGLPVHRHVTVYVVFGCNPVATTRTYVQRERAAVGLV